MIRQSSVYQEAIDQHAQIKNDYMALKPVLDSFSDLFKDITFEKFRHAYGLVASRAWESGKGLSLIPFADFLNHDGSSKSAVLNDEERRISEVIADRNYVPGEEVLIQYGKFANSTLLLNFGFSVPHNIHEQVCIQVDIPFNDNLRAMKLDLMQKHDLAKIKSESFSSPGFPFVIKKVRSSTGKGKGIPQSLRAFARVLCCNSSTELNELATEAAKYDGRLARRPLINRSLEKRAHEILLLLINEFIDKYDLSIKSLRALGSTNYRKYAHRRQMAQDLLNGEVEVLRSASLWLENYHHSYGGEKTTIINPDELRHTMTKSSS